MLGDIKGPADVVSKLVVVNGSGDLCGGGHGIALPGVGVEDGIARVLVGGAMKVLPARFGDDANLSAGGPAVLGGVIGGQDLNFLSGIHVCGAEAGSIRASANSGSTIISNQTFRRARSIDIRGALAATAVKVRKSATTRSRHQVGHQDATAAVQLERIELLARDEGLHCGGVRLQLYC